MDWPKKNVGSSGDRTLFDAPYTGQAEASAEQRRLSRQCKTILQRLMDAGDAGVTNDELSVIARKYTSRLSDLRKAGYQIECFDQDRRTGICRYRLAA